MEKKRTKGEKKKKKKEKNADEKKKLFVRDDASPRFSPIRPRGIREDEVVLLPSHPEGVLDRLALVDRGRPVHSVLDQGDLPFLSGHRREGRAERRERCGPTPGLQVAELLLGQPQDGAREDVLPDRDRANPLPAQRAPLSLGKRLLFFFLGHFFLGCP